MRACPPTALRLSLAPSRRSPNIRQTADVRCIQHFERAVRTILWANHTLWRMAVRPELAGVFGYVRVICISHPRLVHSGHPRSQSKQTADDNLGCPPITPEIPCFTLRRLAAPFAVLAQSPYLARVPKLCRSYPPARDPLPQHFAPQPLLGSHPRIGKYFNIKCLAKSWFSGVTLSSFPSTVLRGPYRQFAINANVVIRLLPPAACTTSRLGQSDSSTATLSRGSVAERSCSASANVGHAIPV